MEGGLSIEPVCLITFVFVFALLGNEGLAMELLFLLFICCEFAKNVETGSYVLLYYFSTNTIFFMFLLF